MKNNYIGNIIGGYEILEKTNEKDTSNHYLYKCKCVYCNALEKRSVRNLKKQKGKKCSHYDKYGFQTFKSTFANKKLASVFKNIKSRCYNTNNKCYKFYGAKGIKVCQEWLDNPYSFILWANENGYCEGLTIDRINPDGNYEPINCRWIPMKENSRRAGRVNWLTVDNQTLTGRQWSKEIGKGINYINRYLKKFGENETIKHIKKIKEG